MKVYREDPLTGKDLERSRRGRRSRAKGGEFEREVVNLLKAILPEGYHAKRMLQSRDGHLPDVEIHDGESPLIHIEAKWHKRPRIAAAFQQAFDKHKPSTVPIAVTKADRSWTLVTMRWQDFTEMLTAYLKGLEVENG